MPSKNGGVTIILTGIPVGPSLPGGPCDMIRGKEIVKALALAD